jgi:hypothetical protein
MQRPFTSSGHAAATEEEEEDSGADESWRAGLLSSDLLSASAGFAPGPAAWDAPGCFAGGAGDGEGDGDDLLARARALISGVAGTFGGADERAGARALADSAAASRSGGGHEGGGYAVGGGWVDGAADGVAGAANEARPPPPLSY